MGGRINDMSPHPSATQQRGIRGQVGLATAGLLAGVLILGTVLFANLVSYLLAGALFAVNMLVATEGGGTFTFAELREDLEAEGFIEAVMARADEAMNAVIVAKKPGGI